MSTKLTLAFLAFFLSTSPLLAQSVTNEINIQTNTGGNTVSGQENTTVKTGSTSTSVNVQNSHQTSTTNESSIQSSTKITINSTGDGNNSININQNGQVLKFGQTNGQTTLTTTDSDGNQTTTDLDPNQEFTTDFNNSTIRITPTTNGLSLTHNSITMTTKLPLTIDQQSNQLSINQQQLTLLPDQATNKILREKLLDHINPDSITLFTQDDQLQYQLTGTKTQKLLGLIPVKINKQIFLPLDSNLPLETQINPLHHRLLNLLST